MKGLCTLGLLLTLGAAARPAAAFDPHEHKLVGDEGAARAADAVPRDLALPLALASGLELVKVGGPDRAESVEVHRLPGTDPRTLLVWTGPRNGGPGNGEWLTFGDLIAAYGDLRYSTAQLWATPKQELKTLKTITRDGSDISDTDKLGDALQVALNDKVRAALRALGISIPDVVPAGVKSDARERIRFFKHSLENPEHFSARALQTYESAHTRALTLAEAAGRMAKDDDRKRTFWEALHWEALACHSLTDLFSPGHMFFRPDPRNLFFDKEAALKMYQDSNIGKKALGVLIQIFQGFMHNAYIALATPGGLEVRSLAGSARAQGDGELRRNSSYADEVAKSVDASLRAVFSVYAAARGLVSGPITAFSALRLLPIQVTSACTIDAKAINEEDLAKPFIDRLPGILRVLAGPTVQAAGNIVGLKLFAERFSLLSKGQFTDPKLPAKICYTGDVPYAGRVRKIADQPSTVMGPSSAPAPAAANPPSTTPPASVPYPPPPSMPAGRWSKALRDSILRPSGRPNDEARLSCLRDVMTATLAETEAREAIKKCNTDYGNARLAGCLMDMFKYREPNRIPIMCFGNPAFR